MTEAVFRAYDPLSGGVAAHPEEADTLREAVSVLAQIRELHKPFKIWDECDCAIGETAYDEKVPGHSYITEVGWTCNYMYSVCRECCCSGEYQSEDCANYHEHRADQPSICSTSALLDAAEAA